MITLFNRLLQTEKRRICILFCTGCFCAAVFAFANARMGYLLSLIHISEPTRQAEISYAVFCLKKKKNKKDNRKIIKNKKQKKQTTAQI